MKRLTTCVFAAALIAISGAAFAANDSMSTGMSKKDMAMMKKCQSMSKSAMMKNKRCMTMMKKHNMMGGGSMNGGMSK